jgi:hypothetical protein
MAGEVVPVVECLPSKTEFKNQKTKPKTKKKFQLQLSLISFVVYTETK